MTKKKPRHGGKREGAGKKPLHKTAKVNYVIRVTPEVKEFLLSQEPSGAEFIEKMVRRKIKRKSKTS